MGNPIEIGVLGAEGRMGCALLTQIEKEPRAQLAAAITSAQSQCLGDDCGGVPLISDIRGALNQCDVLIDFSHPQATIDAALMMHETRCRTLVTGTTGYADTEERALDAAANTITLVKSGNFSVGICMLEALVEHAASTLTKGWDIDVLDVHHRHKKDAPSGTALMLGDAARRGRGGELEIEYAAQRRGGVIGDHSVTLSAMMETITLSHSANDRAVFAKGALHAAIWAVGKPKGLYTMQDVLGL